MDTPETEHGASLLAYPNLRSVARILALAPSTLSRRQDLRIQRRGDRDQVLAAGEVMRLAAIYRKRSLNDVAADLIELAIEVGAEEGRQIEEEVEVFFEGRALGTEEVSSFLATARRVLPQELSAKVEAALKKSEAGANPELIVGYPPLPEEEQRG
jgi:hypothetical protein